MTLSCLQLDVSAQRPTLAGMTYVDLRPDNVRPVQVQLDDGLWVDGMLVAERKVEGVWQGSVRYTLDSSEPFTGWFEEPRIRPVPD
jgi:hypothetical protein